MTDPSDALERARNAALLAIQDMHNATHSRRQIATAATDTVLAEALKPEPGLVEAMARAMRDFVLTDDQSETVRAAQFVMNRDYKFATTALAVMRKYYGVDEGAVASRKHSADHASRSSASDQ